MTSVYLKCDSCGEELTVQRVVQGRTAHWYDVGILVTEARKLGWNGPLDRNSNTDKCPECAQSQMTKGKPLDT